MNKSKAVFVVAGKRLPFGKYGGLLKDLSATDMSVLSAEACLKSKGISPELVDYVVVGHVRQTSKGSALIARHTGLRAGVPMHVSALTVNRLCGSGFQSVIHGAQQIKLGEASIALCCGSESLSQSPFNVRQIRFGTKLGNKYQLEDALWAGLTDRYIMTPMGMTAENLAEQYKISREASDRFAVQSHQRWAEAWSKGVFTAELAPVTIETKKGTTVIEKDEQPRSTTLEKMQTLPPVFKKDGTVHAGNASGICDGAGALLLAGEDEVVKHGWEPLARLDSYFVTGCDPRIMGIGPVPAIRQLLKNSKKDLSQIDLIEVNEAFAPQVLAVVQELGLDESKLNVHGGAIAIGHPMGASGARILSHLAHQLKNGSYKTAIGSACIGGGQGIAVLLEKC